MSYTRDAFILAGQLCRCNHLGLFRGGVWSELGSSTRRAETHFGIGVWGVNSAGNIYRCPNPCTGQWVQIAGALKQIDVGDHDEVWGVNSNIFKRINVDAGHWIVGFGARKVEARERFWEWLLLGSQLQRRYLQMQEAVRRIGMGEER